MGKNEKDNKTNYTSEIGKPIGDVVVKGRKVGVARQLESGKIAYIYAQGYNPLRHKSEPDRDYQYTEIYNGDPSRNAPEGYLYQDQYGKIEAKAVDQQATYNSRQYEITKTHGEAYEKLDGDKFIEFYPANNQAGYGVVRYNVANTSDKKGKTLAANYNPVNGSATYGAISKKGQFQRVNLNDDTVVAVLDGYNSDKIAFESVEDKAILVEKEQERQEAALRAAKEAAERKAQKEAEERGRKKYQETKKFFEARDADKKETQESENSSDNKAVVNSALKNREETQTGDIEVKASDMPQQGMVQQQEGGR